MENQDSQMSCQQEKWNRQLSKKRIYYEMIKYGAIPGFIIGIAFALWKYPDPKPLCFNILGGILGAFGILLALPASRDMIHAYNADLLGKVIFYTSFVAAIAFIFICNMLTLMIFHPQP